MPIKRRYSLITIDGVKELISTEAKFRCRYDLVGMAKDGRPIYNCIYLGEDGSEAVLISTRASSSGVVPRKFQFWPGLFSHHFEFGDGTNLTIGKDFLVAAGETQGRDEVDGE